jgi:hypothetical protein
MTHRTPRSLRALALPAVAVLAAFPFACARPSVEEPGAARAGLGESAPALGVAGSFVVLAGTTVTSTGPTVVGGDLGVSPGLAITGFPPGLVSGGAIHAGDAVAMQAQTDLTAAYGVLAGEPCSADLTGQDLGGLTLVPGVYCFSSSALLTGTLVLDAQGRADAVFVFKTGSTLTTASGAAVRVINGGNACGAFWQVGSSAVLGTGTSFAGSILALTSISVATGASVSGRTLARNGAVTMDANGVSMAGCATTPADAGVADAAKDVGTDAATFDGSSGDAAPRDASPPPDAAADAADAGDVADASHDAGPDACCNGTTCGATCVDLTTDPNNCGACGNVCAATDTCVAGACAICVK